MEYKLLTLGHIPLPFPNPREQQQPPGVADWLENKTRVFWDTACMQRDKGKAALAVPEDILASKQYVHQENSLPDVTQAGDVLERVVWMLAWMFPLLGETLIARRNPSVTLSRVRQQKGDF